MSQSDYIKFKKTGVQLKNFKSLHPKITYLPSYRLYNSFTEYNVETTTTNNSINYGKQIIPLNVIQVFGMKIGNTSNCPTFSCISSLRN